MDLTVATETVDGIWEDSALAALTDYIRIPAKSPAYDADWVAHGHLAEAVELVAAWCRSRDLPGATVEIRELPGRTPVVLVEVPAHGDGDPDDTVLLYGHLDKQPEFTGWREGLGPWTPVLDGDRLYGRGGADDGYSAFAALSALEAVHAAGGSHCRALVLIEASEESGSPDLPAHVEALGDRLGPVSLVICLDSFTGDYDTLWVTTSLRGLVGLDVRVRVLEEGVHSGVAGGAVPSSFRVLRRLLDRIEDSETGDLLVPELYVEIPEARRRRGGGRGRRRPRSIGRPALRRGRPGPRATTPSSCCWPPRGCRRWRWSASRARRRCTTPATCCGPRPRSSSRSGCPRRRTPTRLPPPCGRS